MPATNNNAVSQFAAEAERFSEWARDGSDSGEIAVRNALIRIGTLYFAALQLPYEWSDELADAPYPEGVSAKERWSIDRGVAGRFPFTNYARLFDPFVLPPEEPVVGTISDDIADIYGDVVSGLMEYKAGRTGQALWVWNFNLRSHWGQHATDAMHALHMWLSANASDQFHPNET